MTEAKYYEKLKDKKVKCLLCPQLCILKDGQEGLCMGRENQKGKLIATNYGKSIAFAIDPIEKKPIYHFYPGERVLSIAPNSCNLKCQYCQNYSISQEKVNAETISVEKLVDTAKSNNLNAVSYTYSEPFTWFEYMLDACKSFYKEGIKNVVVSNGFVNPEPLEEILPFIDAINVDLKSMNDDFYVNYCKAKLNPVLYTIERINKSDTHLELTNLIIPTLNDSDEDLNALFDWVADINDEIPLHLSAYRPSYKLKIPKTPLETMKRAYNLAKRKLKHVFVGNIAIDDSQNTYCPDCNTRIVDRTWFDAKVTNFKGGKCLECGRKINIIIKNDQ